MVQYLNSIKNIRLLHLLPDIAIFVLSAFLSLYFRVGNTETLREYLPALLSILPFIVGLRLLIFSAMRVYSILWRFVSVQDVVTLVKAVAITSVAIITASFFLHYPVLMLPRSFYLIDSCLTLLGLLSIRIGRRILFESQNKKAIVDGRRTLIYGAGVKGRLLLGRYRQDPSQGLNVVGFIDDDKNKINKFVAGARVFGGIQLLEKSIVHWQISRLIISSNRIPAERLREILKIAQKNNVKTRIFDFSESSQIEQGADHVDSVERKLNLNDLLSRQPKNVDLTSALHLLQGKKVLVTGAGGSIGKEIAQQILTFAPSQLLILDHSEYSLYQVDCELKKMTTEHEKIVPLLLDLKHFREVEQTIRTYMPDVVFHAAAYKHVHLVEKNPFTSITNNVRSTLNILKACSEIGVPNFVLISSDKAVNPAGVMGATKRVCEILSTAYGRALNRNYVSVRFGNVLGTSGSLIPMLEKQIADGGPLTITHRDMTRYFMTVGEAVSLVLKAATLGKPGDIHVLKMGDPIKILDLAKSLLLLKGKSEDEIKIQFTGLRPGEKIYEELYLNGRETKTEHPDILTLPNGDHLLEQHNLQNVLFEIETMLDLAQASDFDSIRRLNVMVKSQYVPPDNIRDESFRVTNLIKGPVQEDIHVQ